MNKAEQIALLAPQESAAAPTGDSVALMFERLAANPDVDVAKLERLIAMQERILEHNAKAAFNTAFSEMQAEIPTIIEKGKTDKARYALLEDIVDVVRPILQRWGFSISFRTEWPDKQTVKVVGILTHRDGYARESEFLSGADSSGSKNAIQALGSAVSYGHRYTTKDLLNITSRGEDDDGKRSGLAGKPDAPEPPKGFQGWLDDLQAVADEGWDAFKAAWEASKPDHRTYMQQHKPDLGNRLKNKAKSVSHKAKAESGK